MGDQKYVFYINGNDLRLIVAKDSNAPKYRRQYSFGDMILSDCDEGDSGVTDGVGASEGEDLVKFLPDCRP